MPNSEQTPINSLVPDKFTHINTLVKLLYELKYGYGSLKFQFFNQDTLNCLLSPAKIEFLLTLSDTNSRYGLEFNLDEEDNRNSWYDDRTRGRLLSSNYLREQSNNLVIAREIRNTPFELISTHDSYRFTTYAAGIITRNDLVK